MKYTAAEFIALVRRMRELQRKIWDSDNDDISPMDAYEVKRLEKAVDEAEIEDIANLVTDSPLN